MIHLHHRNETPKPCFDDVLGGAFEIAKTVLLCDSVNGRQFIHLNSRKYEYVRKKQKLGYFGIWEPFHTTPFRQTNFNGTIVQ